MSRRALLAAAPALALNACGATGAPRPDGPPANPGSDTARRGDAELLSMLVEVKALAHARYRGARRGIPAVLARHEAEHLDRLLTERGARGGAERENLPDVSRADIGDLVDAEDTCIAVALDALPKLSDPDLRAAVAAMLAADAAHASILRGELGQSRTPDAFVHGRRAS